MDKFRKLLANLCSHKASLIFAAAISLTGSAFAVTPEEILGDYTLTGIDINYGGTFPRPIDESDFSSVNGYLSATTAALVFEHAGQDSVNFTVYRHITAGTYQLSGDTLSVARANGASVAVRINMPNDNTVIMTGVGRDSNDQLYNYSYRYSRTAVYFTQNALDDTVQAAVEEALENAKPHVVPIILPE